MKKLITIIIIILAGFSLYKIYGAIVDANFKNTKDRIENIDTAKETTAKLNANLYIEAVETSLISSLFDSNIVDGVYKVEDNKIVNKQDESIFYEISYKGEIPTNDSEITIEATSVVSAIIYINDYKIEYEKIDKENNAK